MYHEFSCLSFLDFDKIKKQPKTSVGFPLLLAPLGCRNPASVCLTFQDHKGEEWLVEVINSRESACVKLSLIQVVTKTFLCPYSVLTVF